MDEDVDSFLQSQYEENDAYFAGNDKDEEDGYSTSSEQWRQEDLADPYSAERLSAEYTRALNDP
eukprot:2886487-Amphidinium_carterae.1